MPRGFTIKSDIKKSLIFALLLFWLFLHITQPIKLVGADLGRHIKNGELILSGVTDVLYKNYYSYTCGQFPAVNHHWLFGVICYLIWRLFDFPGLSLFYAVLMLTTFGLFFRQAQRLSSFSLACAFGLLSFPMLISRCEVRPEGITILFCAVFWWLCVLHQEGRLKNNYLYLWLAFLQIIWVNTHVFFVLGPLLIALFWLQAYIDGRKDNAQVFTISFGLTLGMCLVNPSGSTGALLPLEAFRHFAIPLTEEQSVFLILKNFPNERLPLYFLTTIPLMTIPWVLMIKKQGIKPYISMFILILVFSSAAIKCVRFISPYGFFFIPLASYAWGEWLKEMPTTIKKTLVLLLLMSGILISIFYNTNWEHGPAIGLEPEVNASALFFKQTGIQGPIFNNYDIGGYLIFHLSPKDKLFVDDRKEAYPDFFFTNIYVPMQWHEDLWKEMMKDFHFNVIFFSRNDLSDWGHQFIIKRLNDPSWAVVFIDKYAIIILKRNEQNADIISRYGLHMSKVRLPGNILGYELAK